MKNQYFGDVNDYAKYGLLRALSRSLKTAVVWMLTPDDASNDGNKTRYLDRDSTRHHDPQLFDWLKRWQDGGARRDVVLIEDSVLLSNCEFFRDLVPDDRTARVAWAARVREFSRGSDLVFFDPDNGLQVASVRLGTRGSSKYVSAEEIKTAFDDGASVLIYQHIPPVERLAFLTAKLNELRKHLVAKQVVTFSSAGWIGFLLPQKRHSKRIRVAVDEIETHWRDRISVGFHELASQFAEVATRMNPAVVRTKSKGTTTVGFVNPNRQRVVQRTEVAGTDHGQRVYVLECQTCGHEYGANGSDIFQRRCPSCQNGAPGLRCKS